MAAPDVETATLIRTSYEAFNTRDIEFAIAQMTHDVEWANGWEGGHVHGRGAVRDYWRRQFEEIDPSVSPVSMVVDGEGRVVVDVDQRVLSLEGVLLRSGRVRHAYTLRNGRVARFDILDD